MIPQVVGFHGYLPLAIQSLHSSGGSTSCHGEGIERVDDTLRPDSKVLNEAKVAMNSLSRIFHDLFISLLDPTRKPDLTVYRPSSWQPVYPCP